ncbi:Scr1 family TA system antitoxin-like transcriptional regulator [Streptomyces nigra]|uniref:Scr1 family TA system antitoxin-like transcriptional regulator n=1 Tax=Streptomyces nigra TaxID=1827580 RepID=UPI0034549579
MVPTAQIRAAGRFSALRTRGMVCTTHPSLYVKCCCSDVGPALGLSPRTMRRFAGTIAAEYERSAASHGFESVTVPGILQTADYARHVFPAHLVDPAGVRRVWPRRPAADR